MHTGFVYLVFDTLTQQYRKRRFQTLATAQATAGRLNARLKTSQFIVHPVSVF